MSLDHTYKWFSITYNVYGYLSMKVTTAMTRSDSRVNYVCSIQRKGAKATLQFVFQTSGNFKMVAKFQYVIMTDHKLWWKIWSKLMYAVFTCINVNYHQWNYNGYGKVNDQLCKFSFITNDLR